jgi:hypothetical protein
MDRVVTKPRLVPPQRWALQVHIVAASTALERLFIRERVVVWGPDRHVNQSAKTHAPKVAQSFLASAPRPWMARRLEIDLPYKGSAVRERDQPGAGRPRPPAGRESAIPTSRRRIPARPADGGPRRRRGCVARALSRSPRPASAMSPIPSTTGSWYSIRPAPWIGDLGAVRVRVRRVPVPTPRPEPGRDALRGRLGESPEPAVYPGCPPPRPVRRPALRGLRRAVHSVGRGRPGHARASCTPTAPHVHARRPAPQPAPQHPVPRLAAGSRWTRRVPLHGRRPDTGVHNLDRRAASSRASGGATG